jgi:hypothetical protein
VAIVQRQEPDLLIGQTLQEQELTVFPVSELIAVYETFEHFPATEVLIRGLKGTTPVFGVMVTPVILQSVQVFVHALSEFGQVPLEQLLVHEAAVAVKVKATRSKRAVPTIINAFFFIEK